MDDELKQRLLHLSERVPDGRPDVVDITRLGRRMKMKRNALVAGAVVVVFAASGLGIKAALESNRPDRADLVEVGGHSDDGKFVPAREGESTYLLSDFKIHYPYPQTAQMEGEELADDAGVSYRWRWATSKYPGHLDCQIRLYDHDGSLVGSAITGLSDLQPESGGRRSVLPVEVSGEPARAEGECEAGRYRAGQGWRVTFVRAEPYTPTNVRGEAEPKERIRLIFDVEQVTEHPESRLCRMTVWFESGRIERGEFTTNSGKVFENMETAYPASDPVTNAKIVCGAIRDSPN